MSRHDLSRLNFDQYILKSTRSSLTEIFLSFDGVNQKLLL